MHRENCENTFTKNKVVGVGIFCGAGGLTRGLMDAGIAVKYGIDFNDDFRKTYENNNKPAIFLETDVRSLSGVDLGRKLDIQSNEQFLLAACAPCQPFSRHTKNTKYDRRKSLLLEVGRILVQLERKPDYLFIENVPAIINIDDGKVIKRFYKILQALNYNYKAEIVNAKDYGVPQSRRRFIMVGIKNTLYGQGILFPKKTHGRNLLPYRTVRETIGHLPSLKPGEQHRDVPNHKCADLEQLCRARLAATPMDGGSRNSWPEELRLKCHMAHTGHKDVYGRMKWDAPSPTLTCKCVSISNGRFGHPTQLRAISLKEAALLQSFPNNYEFLGMFRDMAMQIGNAVPPLLAKVFGKYLLLTFK